MTRTEGVIATWISTAISWISMEINPLVSLLASLFAIVLSYFMIKKTLLDIKIRRNQLNNEKLDK